jgi:HlyD family secretion protein
MFKTSSQLPMPYAQTGQRTAPPTGEPRRLRAAIAGPVRAGCVLIFLFAAGFGSWAGTAPLAAGAIAQGIISPEGNRRIVQHLEGGVVASILVRDGDYATEGQPVVILENVMASATYQMVLAQYRTALATHARLNAELLGQEKVIFPEELKASDDAATRAIIGGQEAIFASRRDLALAQKQVLDERIQQMDEQTVSLIAQVESAKEQLTRWPRHQAGAACPAAAGGRADRAPRRLSRQYRRGRGKAR